MTLRLSLLSSFVILLAGCGEAAVKIGDETGGGSIDSADTAADSDGDADTDSDSDTDADSDTDTDTDSDTDSDTDTDADTDSGGGTGVDYTGGEGPYGVNTLDDNVDGSDVTYYVPDGGGPWPVVVWSHGFGRSKANHVTAATRAASWGFLVVTPNLPSFTDHAANGDAIANVFLPAARATFATEVNDQAAFVGHSAGGLASLIAASEADVDALVTLDGVDVSDLGVTAAPSVSEPTLQLLGEPSGCNSDGNGRAWGPLESGTVWQVDVTSACHCDFESDTDWLCTTFCGSESSDRQDIIQSYAIAWLIHETYGGADAWIGGSQAEADRSSGRISW